METGRSDAAAATWICRGDETLRRGDSVETNARRLRYLLPNFVLTDAKIETGFPEWLRPRVRAFRDDPPDVLLPWSVFSAGPPPEPDAG